MKAPIAKKIAKELTKHNDIRVDNYYWLNDRENTEVIDYLNQENDFTTETLKHTEAFQKDLFEEMKGRIKEDDSSLPYFKDGYWYYNRYETGKEYPFVCRKPNTLDDEEEVMLNVNELAKDYKYYALGGVSLSTNKQLLAYSEDTVSRREYKIRVKNLQTGEMLSDEIEKTSGGITWANDNETFFYVKKEEVTLRSYRIFKHKIGTPSSEDVLVYEEKDDIFNTGIYKTKSKRFLVIGSSSTLTSEYQILDANNPDGEFELFLPREFKHEYHIAQFKDKWYISSNWDAKNFRLLETPVGKTAKENWEEVIPHREDVLLEGLEIFNNHLVLEERKLGLTNIRVMNQETNEEHYLDFGESAYVSYIGTNPEFDSSILRFGYSSLTTPNSVFDYNMDTRVKELKKEQEVLGSFNKEDYVSERVSVKARDGKIVPMSIVYKKTTKIDGSAPCLQYGYGSYGINIDPSFSSIRLSLLDRGFVYAIAHIRGSETLGRAWYEDGKFLNKKNTFTDFIDCGEYLTQHKYANPTKFYAMGGSAGGLLMGAVMNMRPDLWKGLIAAVPFVDVVTTMLDESIPLTTGEYEEWGNPNDEEYYHYIKSYSPYDNIEAKDYPNLLITTGLHDSQVQYWEPAKWIAKLRDLKTDNNTLLMKTNMETGHGGASGRFESLKETAMEYAFIFDLAGIKK